MDRTYLFPPTINGKAIAHAGNQPVFHHPLPPLDPGIAQLLAGAPAIDAARIAKANRRARRAEAFGGDLTDAQLVGSEKVRHSLLSHRPDPAYLEDLWEEIQAALGTDAGMRLTLADLVQMAADKRAKSLPSPG